MSLSFTSEAMATSFFAVPEGSDLLSLRSRLQADPRVPGVTLEVLDRTRRPRQGLPRPSAEKCSPER